MTLQHRPLGTEPPWGLDKVRGEPLIYDEGIYSVTLKPNLQEWEVEDAWRLLRWVKGIGPFLGLAGTWLVSGPPRQGKGLFTNVVTWKIQRYFENKRVLRDDLWPDEYWDNCNLFNEDSLLTDLATMSDITEEAVAKSIKKGTIGSKTRVMEWISGRGNILLQDAVLAKDEFSKDMNKRRPGTAMNLMLSGVLKTAYHLNLLTLGIVQEWRDLDKFTCLPYVNIHSKCTWCRTLENTAQVETYHVRWSHHRQELIPITKRPLVVNLSGDFPLSRHDPKLKGNYFDLFYSKSAPNLKSLGGSLYREKQKLDLLRKKAEKGE